MSSEARRSLAIFPAGSNGEFNLPEDLATVIERGEGCRLWDSSGREYLDFSMGWGSALVGHARPEIAQAVSRQVSLGANFAYVNVPALELAEEIVRLSPACERLRFCASGTEATMYCLRLARAFTGKSKVLRFEGAYHGANDVGVTSLFPQRMLDFPTPEPSSAGIGHAVDDHVLVAPFNDLAMTKGLIASHADELAGVIVEPLHRCLPPVPGFLEGLRAVTQKYGIPLLFDEVVTGFRLAYGGAQEYYGVVPDLVAYGKALGGGMPIGAYGGKEEIMNLVREDRLGADGYVWTASTLGGNPVSTAAANAALAIYREPDTYVMLHDLGRYLREGMRRTLADLHLQGQIIGDGPLAQVVFSSEKVIDYRSTRRGDSRRARKVMLGLFKRGIFLNPMGTKLYLSLAHTRDACDAFLERFAETLRLES
ncbi:MAG: aspartate aminotransferase family protein [Planctomycetota bacterium]